LVRSLTAVLRVGFVLQSAAPSPPPLQSHHCHRFLRARSDLRRPALLCWRGLLYPSAPLLDPVCPLPPPPMCARPGILGAAAVVLVRTLLPYALAFAGAAMLFVIVKDMLPDVMANEERRMDTSLLVMLSYAAMVIMSSLINSIQM
jgi:hypothetical protein